MSDHGLAFDERCGTLIVDGIRHEVWVRSQPDDDGTWHNAILFRPGGRFGAARPLAAGVGWHAPPGFASRRARRLVPKERLDLFRRARRARPPLA